MSKLGVITDGISRDFEHALQVMTDTGLEYAELQFLWEKEAGDLNDDEMSRALDLVNKYGVTVSCISRHNFVGMGAAILKSAMRITGSTWIPRNAVSIWPRPLIQSWSGS